ncbi:MAG: hypothetical protein A2942_00995 [Candidatus Lloydbacteria bacterium RIFCSPLOWO2_01_FULL_50_20]|uniref:Uncharacterized protein n=1 Tax=Candidatus Lloydbacteria bacterium RIFCSPLOWO2_01_FULL_50_20 TaxID=1798665 RepID=A0A1G2DII1_9BACT|nr:MAG: hypothetical protein A3C13_01420 [Candidatus Lloydbacteria bacterium RIFCSPHIGHO2_02_FULL_50_11]OGZ13409.1 MAG: hypothetical protein A2942_00995 [Candidatus Lloydbacteria bacterium RIFCSPLOWO2_01_FULL_50_20]
MSKFCQNRRRVKPHAIDDPIKKFIAPRYTMRSLATGWLIELLLKWRHYLKNYIKHNHMSRESVNAQKTFPEFTSVNINENERAKLINGILEGKKVEVLSQEEVAKILKAVSEKVTGTVDTASLEERMAGKISTDWDLEQHEVKKDESHRGTFSSPNNGVFSWVDESGDVWVASSSSSVYELARKSGLREAEYGVPHSNDEGEWMAHHSKFRQAETLRQLEHDLAEAKDEITKSTIEKEIQKINSGFYNDENYRAAIEQRTRKPEADQADTVEAPKI